MGDFSGYIGFRTDSKRLYMEICRQSDTDFGKCCGDLWQVTFSTSLDGEETEEQIRRYMALAREGETVIACGYTQYSVVDTGLYFRHLGESLCVWNDIMLDYVSINNDDDLSDKEKLWIITMKEKLSATKRFTEVCPEKTLRLKNADLQAFTSDSSYWNEKREKEREKRLQEADVRIKQWKTNMKKMFSFILSKAETPFGGESLIHMEVMRWFGDDPHQLCRMFHEFGMVYYFIPFVFHRSSNWCIVDDDILDQLNVDPTDFYTQDTLQHNVEHLIEELKSKNPHIRVCTYSAACRVMKEACEQGTVPTLREDRKRFAWAAPAEDVSSFDFSGKRVFLLDCFYDIDYVAMMKAEGASVPTTEDAVTLCGAEETESLSDADYLVFGQTLPEDDSDLKEAVALRRKSGKPVILFESDFVKQVQMILYQREAQAEAEAKKPSSFEVARYSIPDRKTIMGRAGKTVDPPEDLNREAGTCRFVSKRDGNVYYTSLACCTCPAYRKREDGKPCKHMFRLAMELGYIK